ELQAVDEDKHLTLTLEQEERMSVVGKAVRAYRDAARDLLAGRYSHLKAYAPEHLAESGHIMVATCEGGTGIRYEKKVEAAKVYSCWTADSFAQSVSLLSQGLITYHENPDYVPSAGANGLEVRLFKSNPATKVTTDLLTFGIGFDVARAGAVEAKHSPCRPP